MKIALYLDDRGFKDLDISDPSKGNNGVGGTQYCFLFLAYELAKLEHYDVLIFHHNNNSLPNRVREEIICNWQEMLNKVAESKADFFIFKADDKQADLKMMSSLDINAIAWAHNFLLADKLKELYLCPAIKRLVFVGKEHYERYIDHDVIKKSTYIYNMFEGKNFTFRPLPKTPSVTYTGSLVEGKGFNVLARVWKKVLARVPDAQLYVIGDGRLYHRDAELGPLGISEVNFENSFSKFLTENGELLPSVHFLGTLGIDKIDVFNKTKVGVMNPSGVTETFGLSAVEMESCGIPVVTKAANGLYDTVKNKRTGFLIKTDKQLTKRIVLLLKDNSLNEHLGRNAKQFVEDSFSPKVIIPQWVGLFESIQSGSMPEYLKPTNHYFNNLKWMHVLVRGLRNARVPLEPLANIEYRIRKMLGR